MRSRTRYGEKAVKAMFNGDLAKDFFTYAKTCVTALRESEDLRERIFDLRYRIREQVENIIGMPEYFFIGELRSRNVVRGNINQHGVRVISLGFFGNLAIVEPKSKEHFADLMNKCDEDRHGRLTYEPYNFLTDGSFLLSSTGDQAKKHRKQFISHVASPARYAQMAAEETLIEFKKLEKLDRSNIAVIVRNVLAKGLLGISTPLTSRVHAILEANSVAKTGSLFPRLKLFSAEFRAKRKEYHGFAKEFLASQLNSIEKELKEYADTKLSPNILITSLVDAVKNDHPEWTRNKEMMYAFLRQMSKEQIHVYLNKDSYIQTLPLSLIAGDALIDTIMQTLGGLENEAVIFSKLKEREAIGVDERKNIPELDSHYKESLRHQMKEGGVSRYSKKGIPSAGIPRNSAILINLRALAHNHGRNFMGGSLATFEVERKGVLLESIDYEANRFLDSSEFKKKLPEINEYPFLPFSAGDRMCPGFKVAERMYHAILETIIRHWRVVDNKEEKVSQHINLSLRRA